MTNFDTDKLSTIIEQTLKLAKKAGVTAEIHAHLEQGFSAQARMRQSENLEYNKDNDISITVYAGQQQGSVSTSDTRADALADAMDTAIRLARYAQPDPAAGLAPANLLAKKIVPIDSYFPWDITPTDAMQLAIDCDTQGLDFDPRITNSEGATVSTHQMLTLYGNTEDFLGHYRRTRHSISSVLVAEHNKQMQRDYYYFTAVDPNDLPSIKIIADTAARNTVQRLAPRIVKTQTAPVIFAADMARGLLGNFVKAISGGSLYRQSSFLLDRLNQEIFPTWFNMSEQPHLARALGSAPFDNNGLATYEKKIIDQGVLTTYALDVYAARKLKMQPTANAGGIHNLVVQLGDKSLVDLLKQMDTGLLVTEIMGHGASIVTGDYSQGAAGFWVENGAIQYPVAEITIAGNLLEMFKNIVAVGNDVDVRGNIRTPSLLISNMMIGGE
jgi:PmbA protein